MLAPKMTSNRPILKNDPRKKEGIRHPIGALLKTVLLALLSGVKYVEHIGTYIKENWEDLGETLGYEKWYPPDGDTFRVVLSKLDSKILTQVFENWMSEVLKDKEFDASVDGKACRGVDAEGNP